MIDLETIGNDYDGIFTTIGAVVFDPMTGELGDTFYEHINWESSIDAGRTITPETIKWWFTQSKAAQAEIIKDGKPLKDVLVEFKEWLPNHPIVWGNGPIFDISKLETAYGYYNIPWEFYNVRCVRTICDLTKGIINRSTVPLIGEKHNALDDAKWQAKYVSLMYKTIREKLLT